MALTLSLAQVDPVFAEVAKAVFGDAADVRELWDLAKANMDSSSVHVNAAVAKPSPPEAVSTKRKLTAAGLLLGTTAEGLAVARAGQNAFPAARALKPLANAASKLDRLPPKVEFGVQAGNAAVGLTAAHELVTGKKKPAPQGLVKAFSLKAINPEAMRRPGTVKAATRGLRPIPSPIGKSGHQAGITILSKAVSFDEDKMQVFGWASVAEINGEAVLDLQGDIIDIEEIEKAAYDYVLDSRVGGDMHERVAKWAGAPRQTAELIESMVFTPEKIEKMGLAPDALPHAWWTGYQIRDRQQWADVKAGKRLGFSVHGSGIRELVTKAADVTLRQRARAALDPPPVAQRPVSSTAIKALGYQRQTRRLAVTMNSRPEAPYEYRLSPKAAHAAQHAPSLGHHYATEIRGKAPHANRTRLIDRARLFADPPGRS